MHSLLVTHLLASSSTHDIHVAFLDFSWHTFKSQDVALYHCRLMQSWSRDNRIAEAFSTY